MRSKEIMMILLQVKKWRQGLDSRVYVHMSGSDEGGGVGGGGVTWMRSKEIMMLHVKYTLRSLASK